MEHLNQYGGIANNYSGYNTSVFIKDQRLDYTYRYTNEMVLIDLSCNSLTGHIPRQISLLKGLRSLNLSGNKLTGKIPDNIGALRRLESLDLSYNDLAGEIPSSLSDLTFFSSLNMSYNNLSGRIPSGQQLQTLNNLYMYIGNPGLCGPPLSTNCSTNRTNEIVYGEHYDTSHDTAYLYLSISAGFVVGLWAVLLAQGATATTVVLLFFLVFQAQSASSFDRANATTPAIGGSCVPNEQKALISFKNSFLDPSGRLSSWRGEDCCRWKGVRCDSTTGHVIELDLRNTFITSNGDWCGGLNEGDGHRLTLQIDEMSPSIVELQHLRYLDLSNNDFKGTSLPSFIGSLGNLRYLNISIACFGGTIPSQIGNLSNLHYLDIGSSIYESVSDLSWLIGLPLLRYLDMSEVDLSSVRNWVYAVNKLPALQVLVLSECQLNSTVSTLPNSNLTHLEVLDLSDNWFYSPLQHNWFWDLTTLKALYLSGCDWFGSIPHALGNMTALEVIDLSSNYHNYPSNNYLEGSIPSTLKNLCNLQELDLYGINIDAPISELMERLPKCSWNKLRKMDLHNANLTGELPIWIGNLTSLGYLDLSQNMIGGSIPGGVGKLTSLNYLDLSQNMLVGHLPIGMGYLTSLTILDLSENRLVSHLPVGIGSLTGLTRLDLSQNMLVGHLPVGMGNLTGLTFLDLSWNRLIGNMPVGIGALRNLTVLDFRQNRLTGVLSEQHFANLKRLEFLDLSGNSLKLYFKEGWIPPFRLMEGYFTSCHLGPQFPTWIRWVTDRANQPTLDISDTGINDDLPSWFWTFLSNVYRLDLSMNQLRGSLPEKLPANLTIPNLKVLRLHYNQISGTIPACFCQLSGLVEINLSHNRLTGEIPQCSMDTFGWSFSVIDMSSNNLSGKFPSFLRNAGSLYFLDLSYNKLSGNMPTWIAERMPILEVLILRSNMFCGNLSMNFDENDQLHFLDIAHNNISGTIPSSLGNLTAMKYSRGDSNYTGASISMSIKNQELNFTFQSTNYIVLIDLSYNSLTGHIPREISEVKGLQSLNLSGNQLNGKIPDNIGALRRLESLDLSYNELVGEIPSSLSDLTFLSSLNMSYINLSGRIPSGQQLQTLNNLYMYIGNPGLCGPPLPTNCSTNQTNQIIHAEHDDASHDTTYLYLSTSAGFAVGLWAVFCTFLFKKAWRIAYFRLNDQIYDKIYVQMAISKAALIRKF
uniref:non-specific serine/threonine protein kinase n=1 Tax=Oryza punctata TaxID=4537 RepID=A0A0E0JKU5_ORYPU